jgi:prepilin-type N-terminal cleavage/methylation domain-containing protein
MTMTQAERSIVRSEGGFTLLESLVAVSILAVGLLGLAAVLTAGLTRLSESPTDLIARQRISEAIESVYMARDTQKLAWSQVRNVRGGSGSDGGVFLDGPQQLRAVGADGLVNTADDGDVEAMVEPGPDGMLGTADDITVPLSQITREISIRDVTGSPTLRELVVTVKVRSVRGERTYTVTTMVSSYA